MICCSSVQPVSAASSIRNSSYVPIEGLCFLQLLWCPSPSLQQNEHLAYILLQCLLQEDRAILQEECYLSRPPHTRWLRSDRNHLSQFLEAELFKIKAPWWELFPGSQKGHLLPVRTPMVRSFCRGTNPIWSGFQAHKWVVSGLVPKFLAETTTTWRIWVLHMNVGHMRNQAKEEQELVLFLSSPSWLGTKSPSSSACDSENTVMCHQAWFRGIFQSPFCLILPSLDLWDDYQVAWWWNYKIHS